MRDPWSRQPRIPAGEVLRKGNEPMLVSEFGNWGLPDVAKLREGVELTRKQLLAALERNRLVAIDPKGEKFDPHRHQAISTAPAADGTAPNHVVAVLQQGWTLADRVLRPALVTVAA